MKISHSKNIDSTFQNELNQVLNNVHSFTPNYTLPIRPKIGDLSYFIIDTYVEGLHVYKSTGWVAL